MMENTDGFVWTQLDTVDVSTMQNPVASIWVLIDSTGYEESDAIRVWVDCCTTGAAGRGTSCATVEILGGVLDDEAHPVGADGNRVEEQSWTRHAAPLVGCSTATVNFGVQSDNGSEEIWFVSVLLQPKLPSLCLCVQS